MKVGDWDDYNSSDLVVIKNKCYYGISLKKKKKDSSADPPMINKSVKALLEDLIDDYLRESVQDIWFIDLIDELANYGLQNTDRAMAFGICLIHNIDNYRMKASIKEKVKDIGFKYYEMGYNGIPKQIK